MKLLSAAFLNHDASISILEDGNLIKYILAERKNRKKHDNYMYDLFMKEIENVEQYEYININANFNHDEYMEKRYKSWFKYIKENLFTNKQVITNTKDHHLCHAYCGFYTSNFEDALCIVIDGNGSYLSGNDLGILPEKFAEIESVYEFKKNKLNKILFKKYIPEFWTPIKSNINWIENKINSHDKWFDLNFANSSSVKLSKSKHLSREHPGAGILFNICGLRMGFKWCDAGKIMGLAQYKNHKDKLPAGYCDDTWRENVDLSHNVQKFAEEKICEIVKKYVDKTGNRNVILSGGVSLNCVSNYNLLKKIPDINIHVDPMCSDNGVSIGRSLISYLYKSKKQPKRISSTYLGHSENLEELKKKVQNCGFFYSTNVTYSDVVQILLKRKIVCLFQGKSEAGQRSLGNRSLLFDPRVKDGRTVVNKIKKREDFRPFAASILLEKTKDWFDLKSLKESPTMSFAVDAYENAIREVPSVIHADNTCRIQTVTLDQNYHFFNLIEEFYKRTNVPMLLNTSFNLAGEPLVETFEDAIASMNNSELEYMYLPEIETLVSKKTHLHYS